MASTITFVRLDDEAPAIAAEFAARTGLTPARDGDDWVFEIAGEDHRIPVVQTLTSIDEHWPRHVGLREPE